MAAFHEIQFPNEISKGSSGGPSRKTQVVTLASGFEERNSSWANSRRKYDAALGIRNINDLHAVIVFWEARAGKLYGFRWKDWTDYRSSPTSTTTTHADQVIGTGNGTNRVFQLVKNYISGVGSWSRTIKKPVAGTVKVGLNGVNQATPAVWSVDTTTGIVTFVTAPGAGVSVTAGYEFDVPARFETEDLNITVEAFNVGSMRSIEVWEIRV